MLYYKLIIDDKIDLSHLEIDKNIQHLEIVTDDSVPIFSYNINQLKLNWFLIGYMQESRNLRILDLRGVKGLKDAYFDIWSLYEIYYPISVKDVYIKNVKTLRYVSAKGAEKIYIDNCPNLERIEYGDCLTSIGLPNTGITEFTLPQGCNLTDSGTFQNCRKLKRVDISNADNIPANTFAGCINLLDVTLSNRILELGKNVFEGCSTLNYIRGGKSLEKIETDCFSGCLSLEFVDNCIAYSNIDDDNELSSKYFSHNYKNHIGIVICEYWDYVTNTRPRIIWDFNSKRYFIMEQHYYPDTDNKDYVRPNGYGGVYIDNVVRIDDLIVFNVLEKPIVHRNNKNISLQWNMQCTKIELITKLCHSIEGLEMSIENQELLLKYDYLNKYSNYDFYQFCTKTKETIEGLSIDSILESYKVSKRIFWRCTTGKDDDGCCIVKTECNYTDPYLETLLPIINSEGYSSGTKPSGFDEEKENAELQKIVEQETVRKKDYARKKYSKFNHYNHLINKYFEDKKNFERELSRIFKIDRIKQWVKPIEYARKSVEYIYLLLHNIQETDILLREDILDGKKCFEKV